MRGNNPNYRCHTDRNSDEPARSCEVECIPYGVALLPITLSINRGILSTALHSFLVPLRSV